MKSIKAICFDMDGVLIDAKDWHYEALNKALGLFGISISRYDHLVTYDGLPTKKKLEMLSMERALSRKLHPFIESMKQDFTSQMIFERCKPVFRHQYALSRLKHDGYRICVCSNSIRETIEMMMDKAGLAPFLEFILSNQDVSHSKPAPDIYLKAMDLLRLKPSDCLVVEDNENGIKAATASGAHVMAVGGVEDVTYQNIVRRIGEIG